VCGCRLRRAIHWGLGVDRAFRSPTDPRALHLADSAAVTVRPHCTKTPQNPIRSSPCPEFHLLAPSAPTAGSSSRNLESFPTQSFSPCRLTPGGLHHDFHGRTFTDSASTRRTPPSPAVPPQPGAPAPPDSGSGRLLPGTCLGIWPGTMPGSCAHTTRRHAGQQCDTQ